jgi:UDP:flavonoid glycosyltransferase YjiC (YdhE family)
MSRVARITKSLSEIKRIIDAGGKIPVAYITHSFITGYTNCKTYPLIVNFANGSNVTFAADGYRYFSDDRANHYITLEENPVLSTPNETFERFMKLAATEGVSAEVAMNMYSSFKQ